MPDRILRAWSTARSMGAARHEETLSGRPGLYAELLRGLQGGRLATVDGPKKTFVVCVVRPETANQPGVGGAGDDTNVLFARPVRVADKRGSF